MNLNAKKYFEEAKKRGLDPFSLAFSKSTETSVEVFNGEVETQQIGTTQDVGGRALYQGKTGSFSTDAIDEKTASLMADNILESAKFGKEDKKENFYAGGKKYRKAKTCFPEFEKATLTEIRKAALSLYEEVRVMDERITQVTIDISMVEGDLQKVNSLGMKCSQKTALYSGYMEIVAEDQDKEPRSGSKGFYSFLSLEELLEKGRKAAEKAVHSAIDFFKSGPCASKKYKAVLSPAAVSDLFTFLVGQFNAKSVHKHLSVFEGKVGEEILSKKLTVLHTPHKSCPSASSFDTDGYPSEDFTLINKGKLMTYFYSVETANEENRESNGCASGSGNGGPIVLTLKPGKKTQEELFQKMKNGIYIDSVSGLNSGINAQTLDFSLPCQGYLIKDGKIDKAVSMIVMAGNLKDLFSDILDVGNDVVYHGGIFTPSYLFKSLSVSGK